MGWTAASLGCYNKWRCVGGFMPTVNGFRGLSLKKWLPIVCLLVVLGTSAFVLHLYSTSSKPLKIVQILPSGNDISQTKQITFKFNKKMVSLGEMERGCCRCPHKHHSQGGLSLEMGGFLYFGLSVEPGNGAEVGH